MVRSLYVKWQQRHLHPTVDGKDATEITQYLNIFSSVYNYISRSCLFPFSRIFNAMLLFLTMCVIYYLFANLVKGLLRAALLGVWINKYSPQSIPKWWQVSSDENNVLWASDAASLIFLSFLSYSWHLEKGNCLDAKCWRNQIELVTGNLGF